MSARPGVAALPADEDRVGQVDAIGHDEPDALAPEAARELGQLVVGGQGRAALEVATEAVRVARRAPRRRSRGSRRPRTLPARARGQRRPSSRRSMRPSTPSGSSGCAGGRRRGRPDPWPDLVEDRAAKVDVRGVELVRLRPAAPRRRRRPRVARRGATPARRARWPGPRRGPDRRTGTGGRPVSGGAPGPAGRCRISRRERPPPTGWRSSVTRASPPSPASRGG